MLNEQFAICSAQVMSLILKIQKWKRNFVPEKNIPVPGVEPRVIARAFTCEPRRNHSKQHKRDIFVEMKSFFFTEEAKLETCSDFVDVGSVNGSENRCLISDLSSFCASGTRNWERRGRGGGGGT